MATKPELNMIKELNSTKRSKNKIDDIDLTNLDGLDFDF